MWRFYGDRRAAIDLAERQASPFNQKMKRCTARSQVVTPSLAALKAIDAMERVISLDPDDLSVRAALDRMQRQQAEALAAQPEPTFSLWRPEHMAELTLFEFLRTLPTPPGAVDQCRSRQGHSETCRNNPGRLGTLNSRSRADRGHTESHRHRNGCHSADLCGSRCIGGPAPRTLLDHPAIDRRENASDSPPNTRLDGLNYAELLAERARLLQLQNILEKPEVLLSAWQKLVGAMLGLLLEGLPKPDVGGCSFQTSILHVKSDVALTIDHVLSAISDLADELCQAGFLTMLSSRLWMNLLDASGFSEREWRANAKLALKPAHKQKDASPEALVQMYLGGTPLADIFAMPWSVSIPQATRFEHQWIVAGSGHGKTQMLQYLIAQDLSRVAASKASIIVIDSQGDLIKTISGLRLFCEGGSLAGKLCLIDPTDIEYPVALNLFDVGMDRIKSYSPLDRERLINGVIELYDFVLSSLLSAELTQKQGIVFRYITRLMLHIPDANIQTLRQLMEPGASEKFKPYIGKLTGTARAFFENEFNSRQFEDTKRQVIRRLYGILENQTFERMFSHPRNKLEPLRRDECRQGHPHQHCEGSLKQKGTEIFGRFFIALIAQAALERATLSPEKRLPTFVYVDECQDYLDSNVALILEQARKFKVGMVLAHQYVGQLSSKLQESFAANTSIKFAGGVSDKDARQLSHMLRTTPEFIERQPRGSFAAFIRNSTDEAVSLRASFGLLEKFPRMSEGEATRFAITFAASMPSTTKMLSNRSVNDLISRSWKIRIAMRGAQHRIDGRVSGVIKAKKFDSSYQMF